MSTITFPEDVVDVIPETTPKDDFVLTPGLIVMLDIDDVLYPWFNTAQRLCEEAKITNGVTATSWRMWEDYGCTQEEWLRVIDAAAVDGTLYREKPFPGVEEALQTLKDHGHHLHLVTARGFFRYGDIIRHRTVDWLYDNDIPHDALSFTKDKAAVFADAYLDDGVHNVENLRRAERNVYLMDAPHNQTYSYDKRVSSLAEFVNKIEGRA